MNSETPARPPLSKGVRRHARDVALGATLIALFVSLLAAVVADLLVLRHFEGEVDSRLDDRLGQLVAEVAKSGAPPTVNGATPRAPDSATALLGAPGDLDDAPLFAWWVPGGGSRPQPLESGAPSIAKVPNGSGGPLNTTLLGHPFRALVGTVDGGRIVVSTSVQQIGEVRSTLLLTEAALLPVMLVTFFLIASVIGRRAATPIERARRQQLEFTADASHELRTPLSVIEAETSLALLAPRTDLAYREALERIAEESRRLRGIVDDLLWLARVDAIPGAPPREAVDLSTIVDGCASRFRPIAAARGITIVTEPALEAPIIDAPAEWLDRLITVLVDNACRYSDDHGRIVLRASSVGGRATLVVSDSGPGLPDERSGALFQRFHRVSSKPGGAGLGLSIADTIVRGTFGRWEVGRSAEGGARFAVSWPEHHDGH